jgi:hypothetical protein
MRSMYVRTTLAGALLAIATLTGCGSETAEGIREEGKDAAVDALTHEVTISDSGICKLSDPVELRITAIENWKDGPYTSLVTYSKTRDGEFKVSTEFAYVPVNDKPDGSPIRDWKWNCVEPKIKHEDPVGFYKLRITGTGPDNTGFVTKETIFEVRK